MLKTKAHDEHVIACALHVAVEQYEKDAAEFTTAGLGRSAQQFRQQAAAARAVLQGIEQGSLALDASMLSDKGRAHLKASAPGRQYPNDPDGYAERVRALEDEGLTTSDAQAVADVELGRVR